VLHLIRRGWFVLTLLCTAAPAFAQDGYLKPPQVVVDILDAPAFPQVHVSPDRTRLLIIERANMPTIADLAQPMLRLAGARINPNTFGPHGGPRTTGIIIRELSTGRETRVQVPADAALGNINWSPDARTISFTNTSANGIHLWTADPRTGAARRLSDGRLNATAASGFGGSSVCSWLPSNSSLLCRFVPDNVAASAPAQPGVPSGPIIQESAGRTAPARTYQDLLTDAHDEALFDYYFTTQLALVDVATGARSAVGPPGIFTFTSVSPSGSYLIASRAQKPYSYQVPFTNFPRTTEVWDMTGKVVHTVANYPLDDDRAPGWVTKLPRGATWRATAPATLTWQEALDEGNPRNKVEKRDKVLMLAAPFTGPAVEIARTPERFSDLSWLEDGRALLTDYDRTKRWRRTWLMNPDVPQQPWLLIWDLSVEDAYRDPGTPARRPDRTHPVILSRGDHIFLTGAGASPRGDQPFLDRFNLRSRKSERLWQTDSKRYESVVALVDDDARRIITRREAITEPPNYYLRDVRAGKITALTNFPDPAPQLAGVTKQLVTYKRADGVPLSATLYLPPGYQQGTRLPVVMWAYPTEFASADVAGQVRGSPNRFTTVSGTSHLFFLTQGYAVFDNPAIPIIGGDTANNTYVQQLVSSAQAAVDKVVDMGVGDRNRVGVGGHSYGAFMTANLLAHSDLFKAGIARSGAYNRTLTPFGFQNEERTYWEAPHIYNAMSPFNYAHKMKEPVLLIHGEADNNSGTFPIQSERMYAALKGHGATVRYVVLPHESHGYSARESVLHTVAEMINWFDKYVKNAKPAPSGTPVSEQ
jgi:dipeptidyl aminopeptidase/acylaminoacyl peptidase